MKKLIKHNTILKAGVITFILLLTSCANLTLASSTISTVQDAADFVIDQLQINEDEVLIYVWGPIFEGEEILSTKEHILNAPEKGFVVYIDLYPRANLFHPVKYIFVSENTEEFIVIDTKYPPLNYDDYQMIETEIGILVSSVQNRRAPNPENNIQSTSIGSSDSRYAVLMNGGHSMGSNYVRYWNDLSNIYITLNHVYDYPDENIIVLCSDGLDPAPDQQNGQNSDPDLDGDGDDDIMYSCVLSNVDMVFADLVNLLSGGGELFVFTTDHGSSNGGWDTLFNLWNMEELTDAHFASLLDALPEGEVICTFEPCFSGGFLDNVVVPPGPVVASSACRHDEYSWAMDDLIYDEYVFHWTAAVKGEDAYGVPVDADINQDEIITMDEAFIYAEANDAQPEEPQYDDYPEGIGEVFSLWQGSEPPETPTIPDGPDEWVVEIEATFSSTTTEPDGESVYYKFDWGDGTESEWVGPYPSGQTGQASHNWSELGDYEIRAIAKDINGASSNWSESTTLSIIENSPPDDPTVDGPTWGVAGRSYDFTFSSDDYNGHDVYYYITWGDDINTGWFGPYASGEQVTESHTWSEKGSYVIQFRAQDTIGDRSGWTQHTIKLPIKNFNNQQSSTMPLLQNLLSSMKNLNLI